jgi:hypothetical protein
MELRRKSSLLWHKRILYIWIDLSSNASKEDGPTYIPVKNHYKNIIEKSIVNLNIK